MHHRQIKNSEVEIRYLGDRPEVIPVVAGWIYNEWSFLYFGKTAQHVVNLLRRRTHKKSLPLTLVAFKAGKPVGTVSLKAFDMETRKNLTPWVTSLFVLKNSRKRGIGTSLMQAVEETASDMNVNRLFLFTIEDLVPFYLRQKWKVKEITIYHSYRVIVMEKELRLQEER